MPGRFCRPKRIVRSYSVVEDLWNPSFLEECLLLTPRGLRKACMYHMWHSTVQCNVPDVGQIPLNCLGSMTRSGLKGLLLEEARPFKTLFVLLTHVLS